jgi:hypothetical protein
MEVDARDPLAAIDTLELEMRDVSARLLAAVSSAEERWPEDPAVPDLASEMAARQRIPSSLAAERVRVAKALRGLPHIKIAHAEGRLSWDQVRWLIRFAASDTDAGWAKRAVRMSPGELRLEHMRQREVTRRVANRDHAMRSGWMGWDDEGRFLEAHLTMAREQGAAFQAAVEAAAQQVELEDEVEDRRGARITDAIVGLVTSSGRRSAAPTLIVHTDASVLTGNRDGRRHLAETSEGVRLSDDAVRRMACDSKVLFALESKGRPVALASLGRTVTEHLLEMLRFRDRGCTFPGCGSRWFLHAHHIKHWADGGKTTFENLTLLCGSHHRRVHDGRWTIRGRPPDGLEFVSPTGKVLSRAGPELRARQRYAGMTTSGQALVPQSR